MRSPPLAFLALLALTLIVGCSHGRLLVRVDPAEHAPAGPLVPPPPVHVATEFDPVASGLTVEGVLHLCQDHLKAAQSIVDGIKSLKGAPVAAITFASTFGRLDDVAVELDSASTFPYLIAVAHPDSAVRDAARLCAPRTDALRGSLYLDADLASVLRAYAGKREPLEGERKRFVGDVLRDLKRNGADLPPVQQAAIRKLDADIDGLGEDFSSNISQGVKKIEVKPDALDGLPPEYIAGHPPKSGKVEITTDAADYLPFVTYAKNRGAAFDLYVKAVNRGDVENLTLLDGILRRRSEKARLLGYPSWAAYVLEVRMAKTPEAVRAFLGRLHVALREPVKAEFAELMSTHVALGGRPTDKLAPPDRYFLVERVRAEKFKVDARELANYFEIRAVQKGLFDIAARMYGIQLRDVPANAWHPDVTAYEVTSASGAPLGKLFLDLYARPEKSTHVAMFPVVSAKRAEGSDQRRPSAALIAVFRKPGAEPTLISHESVATLFHEFGHALHHLFARAELASYSGSQAVARDFVAAPSQLFEEWAWSREVLDLFARHVQTGAPLPDDLFAAMQKARTFGRALELSHQLAVAMLDLEYHTRPPGFDTTQVLEEIEAANEPFTYVKGTHPQSGIGHLVSYDASYYGYQWSLAIARDALGRFRERGLLDPKTAAAFRDEVLARGGGDDEREMLARFLGRPPSEDAYLAWVKGGE